MTGARSIRKSRPLSARIVRERFDVRMLSVLLTMGGAVVVSVAIYCGLGFDAANVTADPADYARVVACLAGMGASFILAGVVSFVASFSIR